VQLNLDLAPEDRWTEIVKAYRGQLWQAYGLIAWLIPESFDYAFEVLAFWAKYMFQYQEMSREIQGIANTANIPFGKLFFVNFMYEFSTATKTFPICSSVVVRNSSNNILHGRKFNFTVLAPMLLQLIPMWVPCGHLLPSRSTPFP
jgi:hypothetical protein